MIDLEHLCFWNRISGGIEPVEVPQRKTRRIAQFAIAVCDPLKNLVRAAHVFHVIRRRAPEPQHFSSQLRNNFIRANRVAQRLVHGLALRVERPSMRQNRVVRRAIVNRQAHHQGRIEPAAKLIAALDINIRRPAEVVAILQNGD